MINAGDPIPAPWISASVVAVDLPAIREPAQVVGLLHKAWAQREPVVVELSVDPATFRNPESIVGEPWRLGVETEPWLDRLHHLVWANNYDARGGTIIWWWGRKASRLGAVETPSADFDIRLTDGTEVWVDGGPRRPWERSLVGGAGVVSAENIERGVLDTDPEPVLPSAQLAQDQMEAVGHLSGPARVIAPAGSGKTRVLTERLRHLLVERGWDRGSVLAVAYNKEAQLELEHRCRSFGPRVRTLNSLGLWILTQHRGTPPVVLTERDCRSIVESLIPGTTRRRANTDVIAPYLDALSQVRLGLEDPASVEESRDDVDGLANMFEGFRKALERKGAVDFDEQIYGAVEVLLSDGEFRRRVQPQFRHMLVDEFQDLTPAHVMLVRLLSSPRLDVFAVGDDDQVIYGHAGADPQFLISYDKYFPAAANHPLTVNYRCPTPVVGAAINLLGYNQRRVPKEISATITAEASPQSFVVRSHNPESGPATAAEVVKGWTQGAVAGSSIVLLARVNSLLLGPQVALLEAGVPVNSVLSAGVLDRTGLRAALAYLRLSVAGNTMRSKDLTEILRRPTRGLPQWFPDRLSRRATWSVSQLRALSKQMSDRETSKVVGLVDDLVLLQQEASNGTTQSILGVIRSEIGLDEAMGLLDASGNGQGSTHIDDLDALSGVAHLHLDVHSFEQWLRELLAIAPDKDGVTLSTVHRVKGREWDKVVVFGVTNGVMPHRLSHDHEEERRILHVAITRGKSEVVVLADESRPSPFLAELNATAPKKPPRASSSRSSERSQLAPSVTKTKKSTAAKSFSDAEMVRAEYAMSLKVLGGYEGTVKQADQIGVQLELNTGGSLAVRYGERVQYRGSTLRLAPPVELWGNAAQAEQALRAWRAQRSKADEVPAYIVLSDAHLRSIALARPATAKELIECDGIGPTKLERYGDDLLAALDQVSPVEP